MIVSKVAPQKHKSALKPLKVVIICFSLSLIGLILAVIFLPDHLGLMPFFQNLFINTDNAVTIIQQTFVTVVPTTVVPPTPDPEIEAQKKRDADFIVMQGNVQKYLDDHKLHLLLDLQGDKHESWLMNADEKNNGLSSIKIYVMVAVYNQISIGKMTMKTHVSRYGYSGTVSSALNSMVQHSNNEATGALIQGVGGVNTVNNVLKQYLGDGMSSHLSHTPDHAEGGYNIVTMSDEAKVMDLLKQGLIIDTDNSNAMLDLMYGTEDIFSLKKIDGIKAVAQKTASAPKQYGIVAKVDTKSNRSYILAMQIWRQDSKSIPPSNLHDIIAIINEYFNEPAE